MMADKRKLRWFQFRLRSMLVVVTAWGVVLPFVPSLVAKYKEWREAQELPFLTGGSGTIQPFETTIGCTFPTARKLPDRSPHILGTLNKKHLASTTTREHG